MVLTEEMNRDYNKFMNFLISEGYSAFFQKKLLRVLPQMKENLHFSAKKRIGD